MRSYSLIIILLLNFQAIGNFTLYSACAATSSSQSTKALNHLSQEISNLSKGIDSLNEGIRNLRTVDSNNTNTSNNSISEERSKFDFWEFLMNSLAEIAGAFVGLGGALWLFYLGNKREKRKEKRKNKREQQDRINYFGSLIKAVIKFVEDQTTALEEYSEKIKNNPLYIPQPLIYSNEDLERLQKTVNNEIYYHSFLNKFGNNLTNTNKFRRITACCDYFIKQFKQIIEMHADKLKFDHERKLKYKNIFTETLTVATELGKSSELTNPPLFFKINEILGVYLTNRDPDKFESYHQYLTEPLKTSLLQGFFEVQAVRPIIDSLMQATHIFTDIQMQNNTQATDVDNIIIAIKESLQILRDNSEEILCELNE